MYVCIYIGLGRYISLLASILQSYIDTFFATKWWLVAAVAE